MTSYITFEYVLEIHDVLIQEYGGRKGILSEGLLSSALEMPKARFHGRDLHRTIFDKVAAYLFHLIQNYLFMDGNKRTASMTSLVFFATNYKGTISINDDAFQELILGIAQGVVTKKEIAKFFRNSTRSK